MRIETLRGSQRLFLCAVTMSEMLYSAATAEELRADHEVLGRLGALHIDPTAEEHVVEIMRSLPGGSRNGAPAIPRMFVAAVARSNGATVLHYDKDFEVIADASGLSHEWVIPRGTGQGHH